MKRWLTTTMVLALAAGGTLPVLGQSLDETELRGENIRLREEPADDAAELAVLQGGAEVDITGEPVLVEGHAWWPVTVVDSEDEGWVRWEFLEGATSAADPATTEEPVDDEPLEEERSRRDATEPANDEPEVEEPAGNRQGGGGRANRDAEPTEEPAAEEPDRQNRRDRAGDEATAEPTVELELEPTPEATPTVEPEPTAEPDETPTDAEVDAQADVDVDEAASEGSERDPYPFGSTGTVGNWEVRVTEFRRDATDVVLDADDGNERPGQGEQYSLVGIDLTNTGSRQASASALVFGAIGESDEAYPAGDCGRIPDELDLEERIPAGDERSGDLCFVVAAEDAGSLALFVSEPLVPGQEAVWFALRDE